MSNTVQYVPFRHKWDEVYQMDSGWLWGVRYEPYASFGLGEISGADDSRVVVKFHIKWKPWYRILWSKISKT
jgi:hypothetical protein